MKPLLVIVVLLVTPNLFAQTAIQKLTFDAKKLPEEVSVKGKIVRGESWKDLLGENLLILTQTDEARTPKPTDPDSKDDYLYGYHFVKKEGKFVQIWMIQDFVKDCSFDIYCEYILPSVAVVDMNKNGIAETSFMYKVVCRSDVSPAGLKLIMHEGTKKYAIRGTTLYTGIGGEKTIDVSFKTADKALQDFANQQWKKYVKED